MKAFLLFFSGLLISTACAAWHGGGYGVDRHYHGHDGYYRDDYNRGGWSGPNIIINVPNRGYYYRERCQTVEVCNQYGNCWLERECD